MYIYIYIVYIVYYIVDVNGSIAVVEENLAGLGPAQENM